MTTDQNNDQAPDDIDPANPAPTPEGTEVDKPENRQDRRDRQARERATELEAERDALAGRLAAAQTREVERIAGEILAQPGDLLELGKVDLADLLDDEGNVDPDEVAALAAALVETRPGLAAGAVIKGGYRDWGHTRSRDNDMYAPGGTGAPSWSDAFGAAGRGGQHYT